MSIEQIRKPIASDLEAFDKFVADNFSAEGELLSEMLSYALSSRGKGVRPILTLLTASMHGPAAEEASDKCGEERHCTKRTYLAAMLVEMIHTASLIHDDVLDEADERRGRPSVNAKWQSDIISYIGSAMATLCEGEVLQSQHAKAMDTTHDDYFKIIYQKTASLLGVSAALGALSVGAKREEVERMRKFGEAVGMAFQIQDDILDFKRDNNTGKPSNNDLREKKITLPMLEVMERKDERKHMLDLLKRASEDESAVDELHRIVVEGGGPELAAETMHAYIHRAMHHASKYPDTPYRRAMLDLCTFIAERDR